MMKRIILVYLCFICLLASFHLHAQSPATSKGASIISGAFGLSSLGNNISEGRTTSFNLMPVYQYFVADRFALGVNSFLNFSSNDFSSSQIVRFGPQASYFLDRGGDWLPYASGTVQYGWVNDDSMMDNNTTWTGRAAIGIALRQDHFGLLIEGGWQGTDFELSRASDVTNQLFIAVGVAAFLYPSEE